MGLQFYIGNSGTGKSRFLYQKILKEAQANPKHQYVVLVPEQFTLQTQKDFVMLSPSSGILNIDVLSFQRLAFRVFEEIGIEQPPVLDETGKIFLVRRVAQEQKEQLILMGKYLSKTGYINEVKSMLSELIQYDVREETLDKLLKDNAGNQQMYGKLHDIQVIYEAFRSFLKERFITSEELLDVLYKVVERSERLLGCTFVLDGFTGFTPVQKKLIGRLLGICQDMRITVTYDTAIPIRDTLPDYHLFYMSSKMMKDMKQMAEEIGIKQEPPVIFPAKENYRFADNPAMSALERNLFRGHQEIYKEKQENISLHVCRNPLEEMEYAAAEIRRLVMSGTCRYGDIAVVTGDLEQYGQYARRVFTKYQIPFFSDYKRSAMANPVVTCIRSLLECANRDFTYESVGRLWRTGLLPLEQSVLDRMQNYILARGIRGRKRWEEPWSIPAKGMEEEELERLNEAREAFITPMLPFVKVVRSKKTTVLDKTVELCKLLEQYRIQEQLEQYTQFFEETQEAALGKEYSQMYKLVIAILERLTELLGNEKMDGQEYMQLLEAGFSEMKVGIVPPGVDEVTVGDIERSRLKDIQVLFFIGVNDGVIPKNKTDAGILSELEREAIKEQGVELSPGREEQYFTQKFYLYLNLTKPENKLYLTYSKVNAKGDAIHPSYLIHTVQQLYEHLEITDEEQRRKEFGSIAAPADGLVYIMEHMKEPKQEEFLSLYQWFANHPFYERRLRLLSKAAKDGKSCDSIHAALAKALYTNELSGSVTRLEQYASCAYAHFLKYGIQAFPREEFGFRGLDFGNIIHEALDMYAKELGRKNLQWTDVTQEEQVQLIERCIDDAVMKNDAAVLYYSARDQYRITRMKRIGVRTVWALTKQLSEGEFIPSRYELQFNHTKEIENGLKEAAKLKLRGKIDRMDVFEQDDKVYVKVMDYKTGKTAFKLMKLYYGTQIQLVVYLQAAMKFEQDIYREKEILPAGIVYYGVEDPLVSVQDETDPEKEILKSLMPDGVISQEQNVLEAMDERFKGQVSGYKSDVIPVGTKKDGTYLASSKIMSQEEFGVMMDYADWKIRDMSETLLAGDIRINPYKNDRECACSYCPYHGVCVQELNGKQPEYRQFEKLNDTEAYVRMNEKLKEQKAGEEET